MGLAMLKSHYDYKTTLTADEVKLYGSEPQRDALLEDLTSTPKLRNIPRAQRSTIDRAEFLTAHRRIKRGSTSFSAPRKIAEAALKEWALEKVNAHLGTNARTLYEDSSSNLVLCDSAAARGLGDTFCGGGSIPFESARIGCDVYASDLNPIACMLTWGALNVVGGSAQEASMIEDKLQTRIEIR